MFGGRVGNAYFCRRGRRSNFGRLYGRSDRRSSSRRRFEIALRSGPRYISERFRRTRRERVWLPTVIVDPFSVSSKIPLPKCFASPLESRLLNASCPTRFASSAYALSVFPRRWTRRPNHGEGKDLNNVRQQHIFVSFYTA